MEISQGIGWENSWMRQKTIQLYQGPLFKQHGLQMCACYRMLYVCRSLVLNGLSCVLGESPEKNREIVVPQVRWLVQSYDSFSCQLPFLPLLVTPEIVQQWQLNVFTLCEALTMPQDLGWALKLPDCKSMSLPWCGWAFSCWLVAILSPCLPIYHSQARSKSFIFLPPYKPVIISASPSRTEMPLFWAFMFCALFLWPESFYRPYRRVSCGDARQLQDACYLIQNEEHILALSLASLSPASKLSFHGYFFSSLLLHSSRSPFPLLKWKEVYILNLDIIKGHGCLKRKSPAFTFLHSLN